MHSRGVVVVVMVVVITRVCHLGRANQESYCSGLVGLPVAQSAHSPGRPEMLCSPPIQFPFCFLVLF